MERVNSTWRAGSVHVALSRLGALKLSVPLLQVLSVVIFLRYLVLPIIGVFVNATFPLARPTDFTVGEQPSVFWDIFARYDSGWYYDIARHGYFYFDDQPSSLGFFPLYPLLMRALGELFGGEQFHYFIAGMVISRVAFLAALVFLFYLVRLDADDAAAQRTVLYVAIFPFAFFYARVYSESLFLLTTVASVYWFRTRRWELGGLAGCLASLTRVNGVLSVATLALIAAPVAGRQLQRWVRPLLALAAVVMGIGLFSAYSYSVAGSPVAWALAIEEWNGYQPGGAPWAPLIALLRQLVNRPLAFMAESNGPYDTLNGLTAALFVASIPFVWRRFGAAYGIHMLVNLWLPLSSGRFEGLGRYCAVLFPFFIWLGSFRSQLLRDVVITSSMALYVLCMTYFIKLHPIF
jgi:hypothetical protein